MIEECELLEASVDVERLSFDDVMAVLRGYVDDLLADEAAVALLGIGGDTRRRSRALLNRTTRRQDPAPEACEADRVEGWRLHDASAGPDKLFAAVVVLCSYDRDSAEFDAFGPEAMMESIMTSVCALGDGQGLRFVDHVRRSAPGQRCRGAVRRAAPNLRDDRATPSPKEGFAGEGALGQLLKRKCSTSPSATT